MPHLEARRDTNVQIGLVSQQYVQESPHFLLAGAILGVLGFLIAVVPYILRVGEHLCRGTEIPIKEVPPTVSELVSKWDTVEARIFFGFELTSAYCILLSWYPYKLRNACCIPATGGCRMGCMSWATYRQFMPPIGLILVACCPTVKLQLLRAEDLVLVTVHCLAAMMMFVGFLMAEAHALSIRFYFLTFRGKLSFVVPFPCASPTIDWGTREYRMRSSTWHTSAWTFISFMILQVLGSVGILAMDVRRRWCVMSFIFEVVSGLAMLANHLIIWYFAPERLWTQRGIVGDQSNATVQPVLSRTTSEVGDYGSTQT